MLLQRLSLIILWLGLASCQQNALKGQAQKTSTPKADTKDQSNIPDDEKVDPPNNISGTYLSCSVEIEPTDTKPESLVGCRFNDAKGARVPAANLAADFSYTYQAQLNPDIQIYAKKLLNDNRYDAAYLFFGPNRSSLLNAVAQTQIYVQLKTARATNTDVLLGDQIRDIARDKTTIPEPANNDYQQTRDTILIEAQQGQVTPPLP